MDRIEEKIYELCNSAKKSNKVISLYDIKKELDNELWNLCAIYYGKWLFENSDLVTEELSTQEWK